MRSSKRPLLEPMNRRIKTGTRELTVGINEDVFKGIPPAVAAEMLDRIFRRKGIRGR